MEARRSHTNLTYLTLSPITSRLPIDDAPASEENNPTVPQPWIQRTSYISGKSAPTTPGLLSRSPSRTRLSRSSSTKLANAMGKGSKSYTQLVFAADTVGGAQGGTPGLNKSKSTATLTGVGKRKKTKSLSSGPALTGMNGEWLSRTGTILWSKARESKGQSWLVSRDSSTSLVAHDDEDEDEDAIPVYERVNGSARVSRVQSRAQSRPQSRFHSPHLSRRGSYAGSRPDLTYLATPGRTPANLRSYKSGEDYFGSAAVPRSAFADPAVLAGPDFVDEEYDFEDDEDDDDEDEEEERRQEEEVRKLTSERGIGLGGVVDRMLGWPLFDVDSAIDGDEEQAVATQDQRTQNTIAGTDIKLQSILRNGQGASSAERVRTGEEAQQGWADAAWLLSVASKVLF